jgi:hypothetical protein
LSMVALVEEGNQYLRRALETLSWSQQKLCLVFKG